MVTDSYHSLNAHPPLCGPAHHTNILTHHPTQMLSGQGTQIPSLRQSNMGENQRLPPSWSVPPAGPMKTWGPEREGELARLSNRADLCVSGGRTKGWVFSFRWESGLSS